MKAIKHIVQFFMVISVCLFTFACFEPRIDTGGLPDEFELVVGIAASKEATDRSTINDDADVIKVYAKVYDSLGNHLPAVDNTGSDIPGVTKLTKSGSSWSATINLVNPASGTITFEIWAVATSGIHLYEGESPHVVGTNGNSVTVTTHAVYTLRSAGQAGGLVFFDKGSYSDGWRYLEAAPYGWYDGESDPYFQWGAYGYVVDPCATATDVGSGETNTANIVNYHDLLRTLYPDKDYYTYPKQYYANNDGTVAAKVCADYELEKGGVTFSDWFLPSKDELALLYNNLKAHNVGGFSEYDWFYWSSSEYDDKNAWTHCFVDEGTFQYYYSKTEWNNVRPVRAF
ncbi:MAG: hypothetical protein WCR91_01255 [Sphaerochaetaceae bacterium]